MMYGTPTDETRECVHEFVALDRQWRHYQNRAIHLCGTSDHVLDVVGVTRTVYVCVVTVSRIVFNVRGIDGNTALTLFRSIVDTIKGNRFTAPDF